MQSSDQQKRNLSDPRNRNAFTFIELVVVLVILSMMAGITFFSLVGVSNNHQINMAIETVQRFDATARRHATTNQQPLTATINQQESVFRLVHASGDSSTFDFPSTVAISSLYVREQSGSVRSAGQLQLDFNSCGQCQSYAVAIERDGQRRWVVVLGKSGQVVTASDREVIDDLLSI